MRRLFPMVALAAMGVAVAADEQPPPAVEQPAAEKPAADGTVSVVVPPPAVEARPEVVEARPPAVEARPVIKSVAGELIGVAYEPMKPRVNAAVDPQLYARPLPLVEAFERSGDRTRRLWVAQGYWKASTAFAQLKWCTEAVERLETTAPGGDPYDRAALDVATAAATADLAEARSELVAAQQELADLARLPPLEALPWPVDRPLGTPYQTHFEIIFAQRLATGRIRAINRMLPQKHEALERRASAVAAATAALEAAERDHAQGKRPIEAVLAAHASLVAQQRRFLEAVRSYNTDIAEYVMAVADFSVPDDRFAAMLIGVPTP